MSKGGESAPLGTFSPRRATSSDYTQKYPHNGAISSPKGAVLTETAVGSAVTCTLCQRHFSSKGILGRHLDRKKGDQEHPDAEVDRIRGNVRRRAANKDPLAQTDDKARKLAVQRYNNKEHVKQRNRSRRRDRDIRIQAQLRANQWFVGEILGKCTGSLHIADFPYLVAKLVPPAQWPVLGAVPGEAELKKAVGMVSDPAHSTISGLVTLEVLLAQHAQWQPLEAQAQMLAWLQAQDRALREVGASLWELQHAGQIIESKQSHISDALAMDQYYEYGSQGEEAHERVETEE